MDLADLRLLGGGDLHGAKWHLLTAWADVPSTYFGCPAGAVPCMDKA